MDDLISRQAAIDVILPYCPDDDGTCSKSGDDLRNLLDDIENLPSAQPEIIRCKDCKYYRQNDYGDSWCARQKGFDQMPTDFCGRAERRTDE